MLRTNYGLLKTILLSLITFGIYAIVVYCRVVDDINLVCRKDGKKTMNYALLFFIVDPLTLGIAGLVWNHRMCGRIHDQLEKYKIDYNFGSGTFWGWGILGALILVGPFIFGHKRFKAMNLINEEFNKRDAKKHHDDDEDEIIDE